MEGLPEREKIKQSAANIKQLERHEAVDEAGIAYAGIEKDMLTYCRYTDVGANETLAIIGDSQALFAYFGIAKLGRELGYNTVLLGWIIPAGEVFAKDATDWLKDRDKNINLVLEILKKKHAIRKVFICTLGTTYITGDPNYTGGLQSRLDDRKKRAVGYEQFKKSLQSYVDTLRKWGKEVFIISEIPELPDNIRPYIGRPLSVSGKKSTFPELHKVDVTRRQAAYRRLLAEIRDATIIDLIEPMCPGDTCTVFTKDGLLLYRDHLHFSYAGSEFQAKHILRPYLVRKKE